LDGELARRNLKVPGVVPVVVVLFGVDDVAAAAVVFVVGW
jgi:hypothetical protein